MNIDVYNSLVSRVDFLKGVYESKKRQKEKAEDTVRSLTKEKVILEKSEKGLKFLIDKFAKNDLSKMDKLITYGLNTVFPDRDIKFKSEIQERGKKILINMQTLYNNNVVDPQAKSSIHVIESFLLRIFCIVKLKRAFFLYMDESFAAVHSEYIENLGKLINEMTEKLNMDMILVTHNKKFAELAKTSYEIKQEQKGIKVEKIK